MKPVQNCKSLSVLGFVFLAAFGTGCDETGSIITDNSQGPGTVDNPMGIYEFNTPNTNIALGYYLNSQEPGGGSVNGAHGIDFSIMHLAGGGDAEVAVSRISPQDVSRNHVSNSHQIGSFQVVEIKFLHLKGYLQKGGVRIDEKNVRGIKLLQPLKDPFAPYSVLLEVNRPVTELVGMLTAEGAGISYERTKDQESKND